MKLTFSFFFTSPAPSLAPFVSSLLFNASLSPPLSLASCPISLHPPSYLPSPSLQWVPTLAGTAARRPRAVWSPTPASCPWLSPLTTPSPERDSPPTTPSARGASPRATKTRVRSRSSDEKMRGGGWRGGSTCHLALGRTRVHFFSGYFRVSFVPSSIKK